jgi:hypothetical protein
MRHRTVLLSTITAFALGGLVSASALLQDRPAGTNAASHPVWRAVRWPFPMDQWGKGTAFQCSASDCGTEINVYLRAKIGFCNCTTGVSDDEELDRISDYDLLGGQPVALGPGRPITIGWMNGRSRAFSVGGAQVAGPAALSVGFNDHCDAIVATAVLGREQTAAIEPAVMEFLNSKTVLQWVGVALGL